MPPFVAIPVINRSEASGSGFKSVEVPPKRYIKTSRKYDDGPLPVKPSDKAPKNAQITARGSNGMTFHLKIGGVEIHDVGVEEILDYVSPLELEQFENAELAQEARVLKALEDEKRELELRKRERQRERAKFKGIARFEQVESTDAPSEGEGEGEVEVGNYGRARPTYTHLFKKRGERKVRKHDSDAAERMSVSDNDTPLTSTENEFAQQRTIVRPVAPAADLLKRRRRKRDKVTGELLPLESQPSKVTGSKAEKKRPRRRRHPLTGELMPIGWRYDPAEEENTYESRREGLGTPSFRKLSISQEHDSKRQRLDTESSVSRSPSPMPTKAELAAQHSPPHTVVVSTPKASQSSLHNGTDLVRRDSEATRLSKFPPETSLKPPPKPIMNSLHQRIKSKIEAFAISSAEESSPEPEVKSSIARPATSKTTTPQEREGGQRTSILNPSAARTSSPELPVPDSDDEEERDEEEWDIEAIRDHQLSDPKTHPPALGNGPVMLYLVKWEGYEETTWEPPESFGDPSIIRHYRVQVGLDKDVDTAKTLHGKHRKSPAPAPATSTDPLQRTSPVKVVGPAIAVKQASSAKGRMTTYPRRDDEQYEVEEILTHMKSDPRMHPTEFGRTAILLYKVKWRGLDVPTWEPASSFPNKMVLQDYHVRISRR